MKDAQVGLNPTQHYVQSILKMTESDPQLQQLMPKKSVRSAITQPGLTLDRIIEAVLDGYSERPALGERDYEILQDDTGGRNEKRYLESFSTCTYSELQASARALACAWQHHPDHSVGPQDFVCTLGFGGIEYFTAEIACVYRQAISVPLQGSLGRENLANIFSDTDTRALIVTIEDLVLAAELAINHDATRSIVVIEYDERLDEHREQFEAAQAVLNGSSSKAQMITFKALVAYGESFTWGFLPPSPDGDERMTMLMHSSGSTGTPKGAIIPERTVKAVWTAVRASSAIPLVTLILSPLNHIVGRNQTIATLAQGGTSYSTAEPDMSTLLDDFKIVRPTFSSFFPRVLDMVYQHYQNEVTRRLDAGGDDQAAIEKQVKAEMAPSFLGDRIRGASVGSAPTAHAVREFMLDCFGLMLNDIYGNTESGSGAVLIDGHILNPPITAHRLRDVPELGYYSTDKPYPRGELCFISANGILGYFKQPEATKELFDEDGYICSGDIAEQRGPGHFVIVDRRKDVLKLSQGEYVAVGTLGLVFEGGSPAIKQVYLYGNSLQANLLAAIVPEMEVVSHLLGENPSEAAVKQLIRNELLKVGQAEELKSFEVPRDFIIDYEPFTQENGLLSSVRKRLRPALKAKYGDRLEALYEEMENKKQAEIEALKDPGCKLSVLDKLGKLLDSSLSVGDIDLSLPQTFAELGGDSLEATAFSVAVEMIYGVELSAGEILSPAGSPQQWAKTIENRLGDGGDNMPSFANIHGKEAESIHAKDLDISCFLTPDALERAATAAPVADLTGKPRTVLLTGASGFLGRFLCMEWLEKLDATGGKLICLIRAADNDAAKRRLDEAFKGGDPAFEQAYRVLADKYLEVLAGDVADQYLGLSETDFERLSSEVDLIVHSAALVMHRMGYEHLFGPNVVGTAEIVRLAVTKRLKPIDFISTVAVKPYIDTSESSDESAPLLKSVPLAESYAAGYGLSKWAAEQLLHSAQRQLGVPVNVFRGSMMLAHQHYIGQINASDVFTRLLYSVIATGLAPGSFYQFEPDGSRALGHYDGTPVDVVAASVVGASNTVANDFCVYNVTNYHVDDGCSLDAFVDWIEQAGYLVERIDDHAEWFERFEQKLKALPEEQRQESALQLLPAFSRPYPAKADISGCDNYKALVRSLSIGPQVPNLSQSYINKCLEDMRCLGLIGEPSEPARDTV